MSDLSCSRCHRPFSYAVHRGDNRDQPLCVGCEAHLRAGGAWDTRAASSEPAAPMTRVYPTCCTSAYCGRIECDGCPRLSILADFKAWRERHAAIRTDPVWCPSVWTATK